MTSIKQFRTVVLAASCALASSLGFSANAQAPSADTPDPDDEVSPVTPTPPAATPAPLVVNWQFKHGGNMNLTVNPDGRYVFSGTNNTHKRNKDFDISLALKASTGAITLFRFTGDAANGAQWSKQGQSSFLSDDFAMFAGNVRWHAAYHFSESAAGKRAEYEARELKREEAWRNYEDAKKRKDAKLEAENKALLDQLKHEEATRIVQAQPRGVQAQPSGPQAQPSAPQAQPSGGGVGGIVSSAMSAVGGLVGGGGGGGALSSIEGAVGSIF